jgi:hypothetical protein
MTHRQNKIVLCWCETSQYYHRSIYTSITTTVSDYERLLQQHFYFCKLYWFRFLLWRWTHSYSINTGGIYGNQSMWRRWSYHKYNVFVSGTPLSRMLLLECLIAVSSSYIKSAISINLKVCQTWENTSYTAGFK